MSTQLPKSSQQAQARGYFATPCWKKTSLGSAIELYSSHPLTEFTKNRPLRPILLMGGVHGDEPEGVRLAQDTLQFLKKMTDAREDLTPWILIPCLNVDGYRLKQRTNGRGVDLNRNYPASDWSNAHEKPRYNPGPHAASEIEVQGIVELIETTGPRLLIHCHSWKPCIVATGSSSKKDAARLAQSSGYESVDEIGYPTPGSLSRYGWIDHGIPVICIEEQDGVGDSAAIWPRFEKAIFDIFKDPAPRVEFKQLIFDLDDTLLDTSGQLIPKASEEACLAMVQAGLNTSEAECMKEKARFISANPRHALYHHLVNHFGLRQDCKFTREEVKAIGARTFYQRDVNPNICLFGGARELLLRLKSKYQLHLVTSGNPATQMSKIAILKLESLFSSIHIADSNMAERKLLSFQKILSTTNADPRKCLSIGNRLNSEIADSKQLGMKTCWIRFGEDSHLEPTTPLEQPDFLFESVNALEGLCLL